MRVRTLDELRASDDAELFASTIARVRSMPDVAASGRQVFFARAPGRLDVMGGIADYSGSLVLQLPLAVATTAVLLPTDEPTIQVLSVRSNRRPFRFSMPLHAVTRGELRDASALAAWFAAREDDRWASYVIGVVHACLVRRDVADVEQSGGFHLLIESEVPEGKGVSSSAALEVACLSVIAARYGVEMSGEEIATSSQWAENHIAGAPCGIMDQMTSACGRRDRLLRLRCQPDIIEGHVEIPAGYRFYGIDSGIRHAVTGSDYGTVRTAAFMGYRIIADDLPKRSANVSGRVEIDDSRWHGYLANITPDEFETSYRNVLPERMTGEEFLDRYQGITDNVTSVEPSIEYPILQATKHPIYENARVLSFASILKNWGGVEQGKELGSLMFESHQSYSNCGLGSEATDLIADLVRGALDDGLFGARITGGGSGGTVAVLGRSDAEQAITKLTLDFQERTGYKPLVITGSSPGAVIFGHLKLDLSRNEVSTTTR